ncbi:hypothetical protein FNV43_RR05822 [Rhamnella rubrinervis]|uniref:Uncharacterized protein n=1 Tax=Rhamnella rubrinervis TaxID=2594499 RepID=A0A8K0HM05_9ROSA|nr:hypothetical protein FNV43_RR05822 [Rhamnella rubrinervis]
MAVRPLLFYNIGAANSNTHPRKHSTSRADQPPDPHRVGSARQPLQRSGPSPCPDTPDQPSTSAPTALAQ